MEACMRVAEVMTRHVHTVTPLTSVAEAAELMRRKKIHHLVVMEGAAVKGVVSDRDISRVAAAAHGGATVTEVMTRTVVTATPDVTIRRIASLMRGRSIGCVPVVDQSHLVGIVTISDLLRLLGRGVDRPARPVRRGLSHRVPHRKGHAGFGVW